ncbi:MAG: leucine-rich repeat domain-containing protein [Porphyromonadaceae bacterium]|nr:leucine-rich repeat domain-containing protein [Porphyromonadaceae bacterium]
MKVKSIEPLKLPNMIMEGCKKCVQKRIDKKVVFILAIFVMMCAYVQAQDNPVATIYTTDDADYEGTISFSISGDEADFKSLLIDAGYGKKPASEVDVDGNVRIKGNVIKIYGKFKGLNTPMARTKNAVFAENDFIEQLFFTGDSLPNAIDLSANKGLTYISFLACSVKNVDFSKFPKTLKEIDLAINELTTVDLSKFTDLETINLIENTKLQSVDFRNNKKLKIISISQNPLINSVDVSANNQLEMLEAYECNLSQLDLSKNDLLENVAVYKNKISNIKFGKTDNMKILDVRNNQLKSLDVSKMPIMKSLAITSNRELSELNVKNCPDLLSLYIDSTKISNLDISKCLELKTLIASMTKLKQLDISKNINLETLSIENCQSFTELNVSNNKKLSALIIAGNKFDFNATKQLVFQLPDMSYATPQQGILGAFLEDSPTEKNQISEASVRLAETKNWVVGARNKDGDIVDYPGIATNIENIEKEVGMSILVSDTNIKVINLPNGNNKKVNIYSTEGKLIKSYITSDNFYVFDRNILTKKGVFIIECQGVVAKSIVN